MDVPDTPDRLRQLVEGVVAGRFGEQGPSAFLQKPFRRDELLAKLWAALEP